jgi:hypothetical protein
MSELACVIVFESEIAYLSCGDCGNDRLGFWWQLA